MTRDPVEGSEAVVSDTSNPEGGGIGVHPDGVYRALASPTRRRVLFHLLDETRMELSDLLDVLMGERATRKGDVVTPSDRESAKMGLVHADLPLLEEVDLVDYDGEAVELRDIGEFVATTIRRAYEFDHAVTTDAT